MILYAKVLTGLPKLIATTVLLGAATLVTPATASILTIQPIKICDDGGLNCANDAEELFLAATNKIWAQAGIEFNYLSFTTTNSSDFLSLDDQSEVDSLFAIAPGATLNPLIVTMWFTGFHFDAFGEVNQVGGNKIVIDEVIFGLNRLDTIAHEVGHLLGLDHDDAGVDVDFLMRNGTDRITPTGIGDITPDGAGLDKLTAAQITRAQGDPKISAVPEPATITLIGIGLGGLLLMVRRQNA